jgi:hypothetical protein
MFRDVSQPPADARVRNWFTRALSLTIAGVVSMLLLQAVPAYGHHRPNHTKPNESPSPSPSPSPSESPSASPGAPSRVTVSLKVGLSSAGAPLAACDVVVTEGAGALAVMDAAVAAGCIKSYQGYSNTDAWGYTWTRVTCINDICEGSPGLFQRTYWIQRANGGSYFFYQFSASDGAVLDLAFQDNVCVWYWVPPSSSGGTLCVWI